MIIFTLKAWEDYCWWQSDYPKKLAKLNRLIEETRRQPFAGIGKPEPLKGNYAKCWSRRIDTQHRLIYQVDSGKLIIISCRYHYD